MKERKLAACLYAGRGNRAGKGGRDLLFHPLLGKPAAYFPFQSVLGLDPDLIIVIAPSEEGGEERWTGLAAGIKTPVFFHFLEKGRAVPDDEEAGVAAASLAAGFLAEYPPADVVFVPASMPLLGTATLHSLIKAHRKGGCAMTFLARPEARGTMAQAFVLSPEAGAGEWLEAGSGIRGYETLREHLALKGLKIGFYGKPGEEELAGIGRPYDLAAAAACLRKIKNEKLMAAGVDLTDPGSLWADWDVTIGRGTTIGPFVCLEGESSIGRDCRIHPYTHITNCRLGDRVLVLPATVIEDSELENDVQIGPFSRLRPGTVLRQGAHAGNFVEMKKTDFGPGSKAMHLSYLGDSTIGGKVNIGAGTITCNYDGVNKNHTDIGDGAFIGSGTELVAPVKIGPGAYIAAGSTITEDVSAGSLALARARQVEKPGWARDRAPKKKAAAKK